MNLLNDDGIGGFADTDILIGRRKTLSNVLLPPFIKATSALTVRRVCIDWGLNYAFSLQICSFPAIKVVPSPLATTGGMMI